jgi:hypothetical protein
MDSEKEVTVIDGEGNEEKTTMEAFFNMFKPPTTEELKEKIRQNILSGHEQNIIKIISEIFYQSVIISSFVNMLRMTGNGPQEMDRAIRHIKAGIQESLNKNIDKLDTLKDNLPPTLLEQLSEEEAQRFADELKDMILGANQDAIETFFFRMKKQMVEAMEEACGE